MAEPLQIFLPGGASQQTLPGAMVLSAGFPTVAAPGADALLLETGDYILLETSDNLLLE